MYGVGASVIWCLRYSETFVKPLGVVSHECGVCGENSTRECTLITLIQFADTMKRNIQGVNDEDCHPHWSFHDTKEVR